MKLINKIVIPFVLFAVLLLAFIVLFTQRSLQDALFRNEFYAMQESVVREAAARLQPADFSEPRSAAAQRHFQDFDGGIADSTMARVTVWSPDSEIIYSDLASIIGARSAGRPGLAEALATGQASYHAQNKDDEKPTQTDVGEFLDIYAPIFFDGKLVGVVEVHSVIGAVLLPIQRQVNVISLLLLVGTLLLIVFYYLVAQLLVGSPLKKINSFIGDVERGNFEVALKIGSKDEIGELGGRLNHMAGGLKRLQEIRNEFVFIAAHELRSPVAVIKGYLSLIRDLKDLRLTPDADKFLSNIMLASERLAKLVDEILDIARSEAGKMTLSLSACGLAGGIEAIMREQQVTADAKRITLAHDRSVNLPAVLADEGRLKEVLANLLSNAIKYSQEGTIVKIHHELKDGIVITHVSDAGFGIPQAEQSRVFERFFRSDQSRIKGITGTGLGLFITKQLVEKMNGKIWFHSVEGEGSTFSFSLAAAPGAS